MNDISNDRVPSATNNISVLLGLFAYLVGISIVQWVRPFGKEVIPSALLILAISALPVFIVDVCILKVYKRSSTGLDFSKSNPSFARTSIKFLGLLTTIGLMAIAYWLFPVYHLPFYHPFFEMVQLILPIGILASIPYIFVIDKYSKNTDDGYLSLGFAVLLKFEKVNITYLKQHILGWLIKGFFFPLMFVFMCNNILSFWEHDISQFSFKKIEYELVLEFLYYIDVGIVSMGYLLSLRLTDTHLRSAEPTLLGWVAALICYPPFWTFIGPQYFEIDNPYKWGDWLADSPIIYNLWGMTILSLIVVYVWATIIFGPRFSNLTHRGIITNGPYRWTKHPAYISKNISWWLISIPFLGSGSVSDKVRGCLMLLAINGIYVLRAKTEEWHLSRDPDYIAYAIYIEKNGMFRHFYKLPFIKYLNTKNKLNTD